MAEMSDTLWEICCVFNIFGSILEADIMTYAFTYEVPITAEIYAQAT